MIAETDTGLFGGYGWPVHFTVGTRPTPVLLSDLEGSWTGDEVVLEWAVPEPDHWIGYEVERSVRSGAYDRVLESVETVAGERGRYRILDRAPSSESTLDYRVRAIAANGESEVLGQLEVVRGQNSSVTARLDLAVSPNPITSRASLRLVIPSGSERLQTSVTVHDVRGRRVAAPLPSTRLEAGVHEVEWTVDSKAGIASGVYFVRLAHGPREVTQRISILP